MKSMTRRIVSGLLLGCLLLTALLAGCAPQQPATQQPSTQPSTQGGATAPAEPGVVKIFSIDNRYVKANYDTGLPVMKKIEENLNITIDWELLPDSSYEEALNIKLSAGTDMPDIFMSWLLSPEQLGKNGAALNLKDHFDKELKGVKALIDQEESLRSQVTSPDGSVYFLPTYMGVGGLTFQQAWAVRQDWLDKVGKTVPTTVDELYDVLKAFREGDPNENGQKDEIPVGFNHIAYLWQYCMQWYGLESVAPWDWVGRRMDSGELVSYATQPEMKELLSFFNKLYSEKLMNLDILNVSGEDFNKSLYGNKIGMLYTVVKPDLEKKLKDAMPDVDPEWVVMAPPKGPAGYTGVRTYGNVDGRYFVSPKGKNTADALRLIDYIFADPVGSELINYGIEGETYTKTGDTYAYTDFVTKNPDGLTVSDALRSYGVDPTLPFYRKYAAAYNAVQYGDAQWVLDGIDLYRNQLKLNERPEKAYRFSDEETARVSEIKANIDTYITETFSKMIVGNESVDKFDDFVAVLEKNGVGELVEIYKTVEGRSN